MKKAQSEQVSAAIVMKSLEKKFSPLRKAIEAVSTVKDEDTYNALAKNVKLAKELAKEADLKEKTILNPLKQAADATRELFRPFKNIVSQIEFDAKAKLLAFDMKQDERVNKITQDFEDGKIKKLDTVISKVNDIKSHSSAHAKTRLVWTLEIEDETKVPRQYLTPNEAMIRDAFKAGKKVAGCTWKQVKSLAI